VLGQRGSFAGALRFSVRGMLHTEQGNRTARDCASVPVRKELMELKEVVKEKYGQAARRVNAGGNSCCGASAALDGCCDPITANLYDADQTGELPQEAVSASLGCGNPTALAQLNPGDTVLDLGSGGGIDVLLSARRVGPYGKAYGL